MESFHKRLFVGDYIPTWFSILVMFCLLQVLQAQQNRELFNMRYLGYASLQFLGVLRGISGRSQVLIELEEPAFMREVIQKLIESFPTEINKLLIDPELNDPRPNALILLNEREIGVLKGLETKVKEGDQITLIPISHGGWSTKKIGQHHLGC